MEEPEPEGATEAMLSNVRVHRTAWNQDHLLSPAVQQARFEALQAFGHLEAMESFGPAFDHQPCSEAVQEKSQTEEIDFDMIAETDILAGDCLGHESNSTVSGHQSGGTMRHEIDHVFDMERRDIALTYDERSEPTYIQDRARRLEVRAEHAQRVAEANAEVRRRFLGEVDCE